MLKSREVMKSGKCHNEILIRTGSHGSGDYDGTASCSMRLCVDQRTWIARKIVAELEASK